MAKLGTSNREMKQNTLKVLRDLVKKVSDNEAEVEMIQTQYTTESGANPGDQMMDNSHTGEIIIEIRYVDHQARSKHLNKTASWFIRETTKIWPR